MPHRPASDALSEYRRKRSAGATNEPFGGAEAPEALTGRRLFVVHHHHARREHWDLRLEWGGVLHSWAVPKGPSYDLKDRRLAVHVEEHPFEYADYEGVIPEGEYGAGPSIVWDRGTWSCEGDPEAGLARGKLTFVLAGYKLRGRWHLFRAASRDGKSGGKEWLLAKKDDAWAGAAGEKLIRNESVLSGRTVDDLRDGRTAVPAILEALEKIRAPKKNLSIRDVKLMLAEAVDEPFSKRGWLFELKYDGYRLLAAREGEAATLRYRGGGDATKLYPEIARAIRAWAHERFVVDGEVVVLSAEGKPSFPRLQRRGMLSRAPDVARAEMETPATYFAFDLLAYGGYDLRPLPLRARKELLARLVPPVGPIRFADHVEDDGERFYASVAALGLEGMVGKDGASPYRGERSPSWKKVRHETTEDLAVVGWSPRAGTKDVIGALQVAGVGDGGLVYAGSVGTGFTEADLRALVEALEGAEIPKPPCEGETPKGGIVWTRPVLLAKVRFKERTEQGLLRHPVLESWRKVEAPAAPKAVSPTSGREERGPGGGPGGGPPPDRQRAISFTNLHKVFWPAEGYTKGDLIEYYRAIAPVLVPYLVDRPVVMTRYPDGIEGKSFFQKDAPAWAPAWIRRETIFSESGNRELDYFVCDDAESLLYVANMASIPLHVWASRLATLARPDWCILDLDPKEAPFSDVIAVATAIRELAEELELPTFPKTSGQSGLHVLVPLARLLTFDQTKTLAELLARVIVSRVPKIATTNRNPASRGGKVYVDALQNGHGKLMASPWCVRAKPGAPVSTPLDWKEVNATLDPSLFTIRTAPRRAEKGDPMAPVLTERPNLMGALARLGEMMSP